MKRKSYQGRLMDIDSGFDWAFLLVWLTVLVGDLIFWGGLLALGFYAVNKFAN